MFLQKKIKKYLKQYAKRNPDGQITLNINKKRDIVDHYKFVTAEDFGLGLKITSQNTKSDSLTWIIPDFGEGSGGHINIFRFVYLLEKRGFKNQTINIMSSHQWGSPDEAKRKIREWFFPIESNVTIGEDALRPSKYIMATSWETAYVVKRYRDCLHKLYFIQDFEPSFYALGSEYYLAEATYKFGFTGITAGKWLRNKISANYNMPCYDLSFSFDKDLYQPTIKRPSTNKNVFFYARPVTPRRAFELGLLALHEVSKEISNLGVIFAGWDVSNYKIDFIHLNGGVLPQSELPDLYSQCDAALVLSLTNLSLLPLEVMACKCPVVMNRGENNQWLFSDSEIEFCDTDVISIKNSLLKVLKNNDYSEKLSANAFNFALNTSWEKEGDKLFEFLKDM